MDIRKLLQEWETHYRPDAAVVNMQVKLPLKHVARVRALAEMYTGRSEEQIICDLLAVALDELEQVLPYVQGKKVIAEDEFGDPLYEDAGPTPRLLELTRKYLRQLESAHSDAGNEV